MSKTVFNLLLVCLIVSTCCLPLGFSPTVYAEEQHHMLFTGPCEESTYQGQTVGEPFLYANNTPAVCQVRIIDINGVTVESFNITYYDIQYIWDFYPSNYDIWYIDYLIVDSTGSSVATYNRQYYWTALDDARFDPIDYTVYIAILFSKQQTAVTFYIRALGGVSAPQYLEIAPLQLTDNASLFESVAKLPIDVNNMASAELIPQKIYQIRLIDGEDTGFSVTFGNVAIVSNPITLTVSALSFPNNVLMQYKYLRFWVSRPSSTEIQVNYQDINNQTESVDYTITASNGTTVFSASHSEDWFTDLWTGADANTTYYVSATVVQSTFGTSTFNQILLRSGASTNPVDLSFLGDWPVDASQVFWVLIVLIVFGCFSVLNAYVGAFAGVATAAILVWLGWLTLPSGSIVAAFAVVCMIAITFYKRRGG